jgi:hypothetical protein
MNLNEIIANIGLFLDDDLKKANLISDNYLQNDRYLEATITDLTSIPEEIILRRIDKIILKQAGSAEKA